MLLLIAFVVLVVLIKDTEIEVIVRLCTLTLPFRIIIAIHGAS